jgi:hypothetical protein
LLPQIVARGFHSQDGILEDLLRGSFHFADRSAEPPPGEKVRPADVEVVWRKFLPGIVAEDFVRWAVPDTL